MRPGVGGGRDSATRREEERRVRDHVVPQLERKWLVELEAEAHRGGPAVIRDPFEMLHEVVARVVLGPVRPRLHVREPDVLVRVDERRDHGLAGEIHLLCPARWLRLTLSPNPRKGLPFDEESGVLDECAAVPHDQSGAFEPRHIFGCVRDFGARRAGDDPTEEQPENSAHAGPASDLMGAEAGAGGKDQVWRDYTGENVSRRGSRPRYSGVRLVAVIRQG